jgi:hypothetical protein
MNSNKVQFCFAAIVFSALMLLAVTSTELSNTPKVYAAANNCDATSTCQNIPDTPTQRNSCFRTSTCENVDANVNPGVQNNNCAESGCRNDASLGDSNNQTSTVIAVPIV